MNFKVLPQTAEISHLTYRRPILKSYNNPFELYLLTISTSLTGHLSNSNSKTRCLRTMWLKFNSFCNHISSVLILNAQNYLVLNT